MKAPYDPKEPRTQVTADDPRIERVFEISRVPRNLTSNRAEESAEEGEQDGFMDGLVDNGEGGSGRQTGMEKKTGSVTTGKGKWGIGKGKDKEKEKEKKTYTGRAPKGKAKRIGERVEEPRYVRAPTPHDSSEDDRHEDDAGFPEVNEKGKYLKMQVSEKARFDFAELQCDHLGGPLWEILTGIEARTKFSNTELKHEGMFSNSISPGRLVVIGVSDAYMEAPTELSLARQ